MLEHCWKNSILGKNIFMLSSYLFAIVASKRAHVIFRVFVIAAPYSTLDHARATWIIVIILARTTNLKCKKSFEIYPISSNFSPWAEHLYIDQLWCVQAYTVCKQSMRNVLKSNSLLVQSLGLALPYFTWPYLGETPKGKA